MKTPLISNPVLLEKAIQEIQVLLGNLSFISKSFGLAEHRQRDSKIYPTVYQGENLDEFEVSPTDAIDSFCFWDKQDPASLTYGDPAIKTKYSILSYDVSLIFYTFDIKKLGLATDVRKSKSIILQEFLKLLERGLFTAQSTLIINNIYDKNIRDIYRGYDVDYIKQPEYAIRFDCKLTFNESCYA